MRLAPDVAVPAPAGVLVRAHLWAARHAGWLIAAALFVVAAPIAYGHPNSYDGNTMERVAASIADHGTPLVHQRGDQFGLNTPYSGYGIGTSLVMAPLRVGARIVHADTHRAMNLVAAVLVAATGRFVFTLLRRRGTALRITVGTTVLLLFASPLLAYSFTDFSEPGVACAVAGALLALDGVARGSRSAAFGVGAAVGASVLFRSDSLLLVAPIVAVAFVLLSTSKRADLARCSVGIAPFLVLWAWYNAARFGSLVAGGYAGQPFSHAFWPGVYGLLLSPGRGIFVYVPVLVAAVVVAPRLRGAERVFIAVAIAMVVVRVVFYARWWSWYGGDVWGPRFLLPTLPAFAPAIATAMQRWHRSRLFAMAVGATALVAMVGVLATVEPARNGYVGVRLPFGTAKQVIARGTDPEHVARVDHHLFDWTAFPFG